jgi:hypothetical protein
MWCDWEDAWLCRLASSGYTIDEICEIINRGYGAVHHRLKLKGWYRRKDGTLRKTRAPVKYGRRQPETNEVPKIKVQDVVNANGYIEFGKTHPIMLAKVKLGNRIKIIDVPNNGGKAIFLDGKLLSSPNKICILMREVNKKLVSEGKPQVITCKDWAVY